MMINPDLEGMTAHPISQHLMHRLEHPVEGGDLLVLVIHPVTSGRPFPG